MKHLMILIFLLTLIGCTAPTVDYYSYRTVYTEDFVNPLVTADYYIVWDSYVYPHYYHYYRWTPKYTNHKFVHKKHYPKFKDVPHKPIKIDRTFGNGTNVNRTINREIKTTYAPNKSNLNTSRRTKK